MWRFYSPHRQSLTPRLLVHLRCRQWFRSDQNPSTSWFWLSTADQLDLPKAHELITTCKRTTVKSVTFSLVLLFLKSAHLFQTITN